MNRTIIIFTKYIIFFFMKLYFKNLDGLRFVAALLVFYHHCISLVSENTTNIFLPWHTYALKWGTIGVDLFFVLSSFLITSLLLQELKIYNKIFFLKFYIRRSLRIWPLYFTYLILGTAFMFYLSFKNDTGQSAQLLTNFLYAIPFGINFQIIWAYHRSIIEILWSVCVEEHFYLIWPVLVYMFRKNIFILVLITIGIALLSDTFFQYIPTLQGRDTTYYFSFGRFDLFAFGALGASINFYFQAQTQQYFSTRFMLPISTILFVLILFYHPFLTAEYGMYSQFLEDSIIGIIFMIFILALIHSPVKLFLETSVLKFLGKTSYAFYVVHPFVITSTIVVLKNYLSPSVAAYCTPFLAFVITVFISYLSYQFLEKRFLQMKTKHTLIQKD